MEALLKDDRQSLHWARLLQALGSIGDGAAAPAIRPFLDDPGERRRIQAAVALAALNDSLAIPSLVDLLDDDILTVRSAASRALVAFGAAAVAPLASRVVARQPSILPPRAVPGVAHCALHLRTMGQIAAAIPDSADAASRQARGVARRALMQALDAFSGPFPAERAAAAEGLLRLADSETQAFVRLRMLDETDALVRGVFQRGLREHRVGNAFR
jgi:HEAT repeat protein